VRCRPFQFVWMLRSRRLGRLGCAARRQGRQRRRGEAGVLGVLGRDDRNEQLLALFGAVLHVDGEEAAELDVESAQHKLVFTGVANREVRVARDGDGCGDCLARGIHVLKINVGVRGSGIDDRHDEGGVCAVLGEGHSVADLDVTEVGLNTVARGVLDQGGLGGEKTAAGHAERECASEDDGCRAACNHWSLRGCEQESPV